MTGAFEIVAFGAFSLIAIVGALGMTTTMSMFRSGIFLMASFFGVAGLFILLSADLIGILQIMMYVGGMLVMILFMVMFMHGAMMAGMKGMAPLERWFSKGLVPREAGMSENHRSLKHAEKHEKSMQRQHDSSTGDQPDRGDHDRGGHAGHSGMEQIDMEEMSMVTPARRVAAWLALAIGILLVALLLLRPAWKLTAAHPDPDSARRVGHLLMEKYMVGFEGAGILILIGIFGAVLLARPSSYPDDPSRSGRVALDDKPPPIDDERLAPLVEAVRANGGEKA